jgi:hypothetical protein
MTIPVSLVARIAPGPDGKIVTECHSMVVMNDPDEEASAAVLSRFSQKLVLTPSPVEAIVSQPRTEMPVAR